MMWYKETVDQVMQTLQTTQDGLGQEERTKRLAKHGYNQIEVKKKVHPLRKFFKHFTDLLMIILLIAALLKFFTGDVIEGSIILAVVVVNSFVGYWQERKAEESLNGLKEMMGQEAVIFTEGIKELVEAKELIIGDIIALKAGDVVPADIRLIEVHDFMVEEAALTGESEAIEKTSATIKKTVATGDQVNMAFSGTLVQTGSAIGVVVENSQLNRNR